MSLKYVKIIFSLSLVLLCNLSFSAQKQKGLTKDFENADMFIYPANEIIVDSSYETMNEKGDSSKGAGVPKKNKKFVSVVSNPIKALHGNNYMTVKGCNDRVQIYIRSKPKHKFESGKHTVSTWLRGNGTFQFQILLFSKKVYLKSIMSNKLKIASDKWEKFSFELDAPSSVKLKGKTSNVARISPAFLINGDIDFDKSSMMLTADLNKIKTELKAMDSPLAKGKLPLIICQRVEKAPKIDGVLDSKEWKYTDNTTGFVELASQKMSPKQPYVSACYDQHNIYFGARSVRTRPFNAGKDKNSKFTFTQHVDAQEVWIKSPDSKLFQFYGTPAGGILVPKDPKLNYVSKYRDSGETVGGVLTFGKTIWTSEIAIPLKELSIKSPQAGDVWKVNFNADYAVSRNETKRKASDWTTWSPVKGFKNYKGFGNLIFSDRVPSVRYDSIGDLNNGQIRITATVNSPVNSRIRFVAFVKDNNVNPVRMSLTKVINISGGKSGKIELKGQMSVNSPTDYQLTVLAFNTETGDLYSALKIPFQCKPSFKMTMAPVHGKKILYIKLNAKDITIPIPEIIASFTIKNRDGTIVAQKNIKMPRKKINDMMQLGLDEIKPGEYEVWCELKKDASNKDYYAITMQEMIVPDLKKIPWWNNKIGITDEIPPPWKAVKVNNNKVAVTERVYTLAGNGLPRNMNIFGEEIFTSPPQIVCNVNGKKIKPVWSSLKLKSKKAEVVTYTFSGKADSIQLSGSVAIEYDGFAMWKFKVHKNPSAKLGELALEFPFKLKYSHYVRGNALIKNEIYCAFLGYEFKKEKENKPKFVNSHSSIYGWQWPETMMHQLWTGGDKSGFSLMIDSDQFFKGNKRYSYTKTRDSHIMRLHLVSKPVKLAEDLTYEIAYQATPMKPRPQDPKIWHTTIEGRDGTMDGFKKRVYTTEGLTYWDLKPLCNPTTYTSLAKIQSRMKTLRQYGMKLVPYFCFSYVGTGTPHFKAFEQEWRNHPGEIWNTLRGPALFCNPKSSFKDYIIWSAAMVYDKLKYNGLYLDVSRPFGSTSPFHDAGYEKNGKRIPTANIFAMREVYKRIYTHYHTGGRKGILFLHGLNYPGTDGFTDVNTEGESWYTEMAKGYSRITPEFFRIRDMKTQYGNPYVFFSSYYYDWKSKSIGYVAPLSEMFAITLPHRVLPAIGRREIWPYWDYIDKWWTDTEFLPYWDNNGAIVSKDKKILASAYIKNNKEKVILVVANWYFENKNAEITINLKKLFGKTGQLFLAANISAGKLKLNEQTLIVPLMKRNFAFIEIEAKKPGNYQVNIIKIKQQPSKGTGGREGRFSYSTDVPSVEAHKDTARSSILKDGNWSNAALQSVQYDGDVNILLDLLSNKKVSDVTVYAYHKSKFQVGTITIYTSVDKKNWKKVKAVTNNNPEQKSISVPALAFKFILNMKTRYIKVAINRKPGSNRLLIGEIVVN
jgi:Glycoside hydrolase 123, N-terminal domain/F5/8 type C domain